jgi:hypothetical protein
MSAPTPRKKHIDLSKCKVGQREGCVPECKPTIKTIKTEIRQAPLHHRLSQSQDRIGVMCKDGRGPSMSVPPRSVDDDFFIVTTLEDAASELAGKDAQILALREALVGCASRLQIELCRQSGETIPDSAKNAPSALQNIRNITKAMSPSPPPVVPLDDVRPVINAATKCLRYLSMLTQYELEFSQTLEAFTAKHPLP